MRAQSSLATLATSLALLAEPAFAADKTCNQARSAYDRLMSPHLSQTDIELGYKIPFSNCSPYGLEFGTNITRETAQAYRFTPVETAIATKKSISEILENNGNVHVYKKSGKDTYGFGFWRGGIEGRFEERRRGVTTSFEFRVTPKKANIMFQLTFQ